jgi:hypothetical protein
MPTACQHECADKGPSAAGTGLLTTAKGPLQRQHQTSAGQAANGLGWTSRPAGCTNKAYCQPSCQHPTKVEKCAAHHWMLPFRTNAIHMPELPITTTSMKMCILLRSEAATHAATHAPAAFPAMLHAAEHPQRLLMPSTRPAQVTGCQKCPHAFHAQQGCNSCLAPHKSPTGFRDSSPEAHCL